MPHMHSKWNGLNNDGRYLYVLAHALGCGDAGPTLAQVCNLCWRCRVAG